MSRQINRRTFLGGLAALMTFASRTSWTKPEPDLKRWTCTNQDCDPYVYDPNLGDINVADPEHPIPPGVSFNDLPDDWICPICGDRKSDFLPLSR